MTSTHEIGIQGILAIFILLHPKIRERVKKAWQDENIRRWVVEHCHKMRGPASRFVMPSETIKKIGDAAIMAAYKASEPEIEKERLEQMGLSSNISKKKRSRARDGAIKWFTATMTELLKTRPGIDEGTEIFDRQEFLRSPLVWHEQSYSKPQITYAMSILTEKLNFKGVSFYTLRHTCATRFDEAGISRPHIQAILGHTNLKTTEGYTPAVLILATGR